MPVAEALGIDRLVKLTSLGLAQPCRICLSALLGSTKSIKEKDADGRRASSFRVFVALLQQGF